MRPWNLTRLFSPSWREVTPLRVTSPPSDRVITSWWGEVRQAVKVIMPGFDAVSLTATTLSPGPSVAMVSRR